MSLTKQGLIFAQIGKLISLMFKVFKVIVVTFVVLIYSILFIKYIGWVYFIATTSLLILSIMMSEDKKEISNTLFWFIVFIAFALSCWKFF